MTNSEQFALKDLIASEHLALHTNTMGLDAVFAYIMSQNDKSTPDPPFLIGIDGSVTAGKSFTAERLLSYLSRHGMNCVLVHGDWFMSSRRQRKEEIEKAARGSYKISDYDAAACNFGALQAVLRQIKQRMHDTASNRAGIVIPNAYNRETGECDKEMRIVLPEKPIIIFEGTGVLGPASHEAFDLSIRVDVDTYEETVRRLAARELEKPPALRLDFDFVKERYDLIDHPYDQYLRARDRQNFDILLDTSAPTSIKIYERA